VCVHARTDAYKQKVLTSVRLISVIHRALRMPDASEFLGQIFVIV